MIGMLNELNKQYYSSRSSGTAYESELKQLTKMNIIFEVDTGIRFDQLVRQINNYDVPEYLISESGMYIESISEKGIYYIKN